ncbi:type II 3-dehydroquinate dehydratase [Hornefia butyriciproducens]|uniref:type II 3-dehydroquinate dehydratase n=1 Tax=Hornefia butyriciproducens TaxID=2652293 RepID=UPI0029F89EF5|nr:type II 3-dehydroquinate dehydratase [Hornefia butyriciproducens]MCI7414043.1 type II 3-dehydroquinate dehydratase [Clostridiales bacterium]MDD7019160.1 type II 3-dehydroquinate dehydratase [Hornefia butyriciproducens]MDY5423241.1 type II 3-dehydroquinate dehydratase [Hornefia butyriciproducens]MDY5463273.1 type II 3-dehydroquinate dehydratase [Hornefia butyriciproducens]MDY6212695.1 type II 3-dehydroquinate dehydratase [Hornefia butyriciproducens]
MKVFVINGPNLNMLGIREPDIYGKKTYQDLLHYIDGAAQALDVTVEYFQSNHEGDLVDMIQNAYEHADGIVINPAAYTHTSIAILDALKAVGLPAVEVHLSDVDQREDFRRVSFVRDACIGTITGKGFDGYVEGIKLLLNHRAGRE